MNCRSYDNCLETKLRLERSNRHFLLELSVEAWTVPRTCRTSEFSGPDTLTRKGHHKLSKCRRRLFAQSLQLDPRYWVKNRMKFEPGHLSTAYQTCARGYRQSAKDDNSWTKKKWSMSLPLALVRLSASCECLRIGGTLRVNCHNWPLCQSRNRSVLGFLIGAERALVVSSATSCPF